MRLDRSRNPRRRRMLAAFSVLALLAPTTQELFSPARADEPRGLGRFFRFGKDRNAEADRSESPRPDDPGANPSDSPRPTPETPSPYNPGALYPSGGYGTASPNLTTLPSTTDPASPAAAQPGPSTPSLPNSPTNRIIPQPRTSHPVTEADPILTRVSLGRSDDGHQFGMFFQVYADGTVIDTEGAHHVSLDDLRPLIDALRSADVGRLKGHCGGPPTDFIEQVHLTVYDHNRGRLQANHFSYSGNPQGCDPSIRALQTAIDALQMKVASPGLTPSPTETAPSTAYSSPVLGGVPVPPAPTALSPANDAAPPLPGAGAPIGLTPAE